MTERNSQVYCASPDDMVMTTPNPKPLRIYQAWKGNNRFCCGGRLVFGPDAASLYLTTFLIGAPAFTFCIRMLVWIRNGDPLFNYLELTFGCILTFLVFLFLFLTSGRDPGIIPRNPRVPDLDSVSYASSNSMEWLNYKNPSVKVPRFRDIKVNGHSFRVKFCDTCFLYRPPRASHCSICNNCVQRFDHHCPWVGQCIALRNYPFFICFISSSTLLCIYVFACSWINLLRQPGYMLRVMSHDVVSVVLIVYCFIAVWFVGGLTVFHFYLISTNQTTYENFRYRYDKRENPFRKGILENFTELFLAKIPPALVDFRALAPEDNVIMDSVRSELERRFSLKEKHDIETGGSNGGKDSSVKKLPSNYPNYDTGVDDNNLKKKGGDHVPSANSFSFPVDQEPQQVSHRISGKSFQKTISQGGEAPERL